MASGLPFARQKAERLNNTGWRKLFFEISCIYSKGENHMADNGGGSSVGIVAILVIFLILVAAALFVFRGSIFGGKKSVDVNVTTPAR